MDDALAHRLEDRLADGESRFLAAGHEGERAGAGAADAARNRRVEAGHAGGERRLMGAARAVDVDGRANR